MNLEQIRERAKNGFRPFRVQLSNGRTFDVPHPEFLIIGRNVIGILGKNDVITTVDALHIASVEDFHPKRRK
jgi:hypothetical protein